MGPNGSGKSNVIDSMLFVFGYRASKLRSKKISVLIHNSEQFPNVKSCTVAVHFAQIIDRTEREFDLVPDSEFVVSRTANKDNSSWYQLNGTRVQFKEVAKLLRKHGIDLDHNRFLILQVCFLCLLGSVFYVLVLFIGWSRADCDDEAESTKRTWIWNAGVFGRYYRDFEV